MEYKTLFDDFLKKNYEDTDFEIEELKENQDFVFGYIKSKNEFDIPLLVLDKKSNEIKDEILPPFTDDTDAVTIWNKTTKPNEEKGENEMEEKKIRDLLKRYGAEDNEIENFMADLKDTKEEIKEEIEEDDDYVLSPKNLEVLKATEEGKDLIMRAPEMTKEELKKAIYDFLNNKKSE